MAKRQITERDLETEEGNDPPLDDGAQDYASFLKRSAAERQLLKDRVAEADKGVFVSAEAMLRWVKSWGTENELPRPEPDVFLKPRRS